MARKHGEPGRSEAAAQRRHKSLQMRMGGMRYYQIAAELGISEATAYQDVQHELERTSEMHRADREQFARMELDRLEELFMAHWPKARRGDEKAGNFILRIMERRAKLTGLDQQVYQPYQPSPLDRLTKSLESYATGNGHSDN